jgi:hypothetical protein
LNNFQCGANAFARVADIRVDPDQTLPSEVEATISPTGNITSMVFVLSVDTNFAAIDSTKSVYSDLWFYVVLTANQDWSCSLQSRRLQLPGGEYYSFHFPR